MQLLSYPADIRDDMLINNAGSAAPRRGWDLELSHYSSESITRLLQILCLPLPVPLIRNDSFIVAFVIYTCRGSGSYSYMANMLISTLLFFSRGASLINLNSRLSNRSG